MRKRRVVKNPLKCAECGRVDQSAPGYTGTDKSMRCHHCGGIARRTAQGIPVGHPATMCRDCCPTGHGTRRAAEPFVEQSPDNLANEAPNE